MKKLLTIIIAALISAPVFAFNFNDGTFEIDSAIKAEINLTVEKEINTIAEKIGVFEKNNMAQNSEPPILLKIRQAMRNEKKNIERNVRTRRVSPINRIFKEQQIIQQQRFKNMTEWDVPSKIFDYIEANFNLQLIKNVNVICSHLNGTIIEVSFSYDGKSVKVFYTYTETPLNPSITHKISK